MSIFSFSLKLNTIHYTLRLLLHPSVNISFTKRQRTKVHTNHPTHKNHSKCNIFYMQMLKRLLHTTYVRTYPHIYTDTGNSIFIDTQKDYPAHPLPFQNPSPISLYSRLNLPSQDKFNQIQNSFSLCVFHFYHSFFSFFLSFILFLYL